MIILYFDVETTGLNYWEHGIYQIAGFIDQTKPIGTYTSDMFNLKMNPKRLIDDSALKFSKVSKQDIESYPDQADVFKQFIDLISLENRREKIHLCGYNNSAFDNLFLKEWFKMNDSNIYDHFYTNSIDVMILASEHLKAVRRQMNSFSLLSVAEKLSIEVDSNKLHEATYDIEITKKIYDKIKSEDQYRECWDWKELTEWEKNQHRI